jgi:hypothetical protein
MTITPARLAALDPVSRELAEKAISWKIWQLVDDKSIKPEAGKNGI